MGGGSLGSGYMKRIRERILSAEDGTIFAISDFEDVADSATVRQSLNRLVQAGILRRILRGIFEKPKYSSVSFSLEALYILQEDAFVQISDSEQKRTLSYDFPNAGIKLQGVRK